jgi:hypothetical protein
VVAFDPESEKLGWTLDVPLRKNDHPPGRAADDEYGIESKFWLKLPDTVTAVAWPRASVAAVAAERAKTAVRAMHFVLKSAMSDSRAVAEDPPNDTP